MGAEGTAWDWSKKGKAILGQSAFSKLNSPPLSNAVSDLLALPLIDNWIYV